MFSDEDVMGKPADVFGMALIKDGGEVETQYRDSNQLVETVPPYRVPTLSPSRDSDDRGFWERVRGRIKHKLITT
jgi:hypothetical protein